MGIRYGRDYRDIISDLTAALQGVDCHELLEMSAEDWEALEGDERSGCIRTLADDVFYALGVSPTVQVGGGRISHDRTHHIIKICQDDNVIRVVHLV
ncbi:hypothetical protein [Paenibacillus hamazuiensis]|uniref:hypothetical protein n=1 Tax=Paenibacillus hamazuiensis TaxID=2936508 RepID=UPI00200EDE1D|nr:hypothetical protein [Paenibacillus hamazuiensis]